MLALLEQLKTDHHISELSYQFAKFIDRQQQGLGYSTEQQHLATLLSALMINHLAEGHSCLDLESTAAKNPFGLNRLPEYHSQILQKIGNISPLVWQQQLADHIAFSQDSTQNTPLLFQQNKLYFHRYWQAEQQIAMLLKRTMESVHNEDHTLIKRILDRFFSVSTPTIDWQKIAVATALKQPFCLISGGPGTGKTRTVAILLSALQIKQLEQGDNPLNIALVAPTGKAAARLKESITANLSQLNLPESLKQTIPNQASTIHSLIGIRPDSDEPHHTAKNPLNIDLLVVDEASMIDLFLMEKLLNALKTGTRIVMLGDKDQLASVESGNLMAEFGHFLTLGYSQTHCDYLNDTTGYTIPSIEMKVPTICDCLVHLRHSYRFDAHSGIGQLASEINAMQGVRSWQKVANSTFSDLKLIDYPPIQAFTDKAQWTQHCVRLVVDHAVNLYRDYLHAVQQRQRDPHTIEIRDIFQRFQQVRFLSALRVSELGVERLNQSIAEALQRQGLIQFRHSRESYPGKPILITENVPALQVFSGDIGIILPDEQGKLRAYFETEINGKPHHISLSRLPNHEPAYVMTVHKSQGSEFTHTLLVLPLHSSPVLTKELLYTAVTRAKKTFTLFSLEQIWKTGVQTCNQRQSGLMNQLKEI
ncbi:MAG: exodeoxyribonuclease V subunit alpha [Pasteurellaceae bacterium]|nr:exodeoxyribonuclease V subunit alpha [Pasteurellaceae bacterium]